MLQATTEEERAYPGFCQLLAQLRSVRTPKQRCLFVFG